MAFSDLLWPSLAFSGLPFPSLPDSQILMPCWECYDFEAAATHEVGHVLGLSHPDNVEGALCGNCGGTWPGVNSYHEGLVGGGRLSAPDCLTPWERVKPGVPPGSEWAAQGVVRPSIMKALTQHSLPIVP